ncbi:MAG: DivIVA domain-containing protein [Clostridia bacterium]
MLSAQSIREKKFEKAIFGGFEVRGVENYIEELAAEFSAMQKENVALKQKLKEINDKNEEYRSVENSMRKALISAQTIANEMVEKAQEERDRILNDASEIAHEQINTYRKQIAEEQKTLEESQDKTAKFVSAITAFYEKQIKEVIEFSREMPAIQARADISIADFTLDLSKENAKKMDDIADEESGYTNDILEKIKREALNPQVVAAMSQDTADENFIDLEVKQGEPEQVAVPEEKKATRHSKFNISELEFGTKHEESKKY